MIKYLILLLMLPSLVFADNLPNPMTEDWDLNDKTITNCPSIIDKDAAPITTTESMISVFPYTESTTITETAMSGNLITVGTTNACITLTQITSGVNPSFLLMPTSAVTITMDVNDSDNVILSGDAMDDGDSVQIGPGANSKIPSLSCTQSDGSWNCECVTGFCIDSGVTNTHE